MTIEQECATNLSFPPLVLPHQDLFWDDEELETLLIKEKETSLKFNGFSVSLAREECVKWIVKINSHYGFSALTAILAVNYLDRFLLSLNFLEEKPWVTHLAAVTCLSLAAKVEETHVPLLLDLQVGGSTNYVLESKTIQKMELLVLSSLQWRMNPVTPFSFLDHIIRRLGMKRRIIHLEFLKRCENLLLLVISDSRLVQSVPSVLATATMLHVVHQAEHCNDIIDYEKELMGVLKIINKEEVNDCYELISDILSNNGLHDKNCPKKRKTCPILSRPNGVIDAFFSSDSSNDLWKVSSTPSDQQPIFKKLRVQEQRMKLPLSLSRVVVDTLRSPH